MSNYFIDVKKKYFSDFENLFSDLKNLYSDFGDKCYLPL